MARLSDIAPLLKIVPLVDTDRDNAWHTLALIDSDSHPQALVTCLDFASECDADPMLQEVMAAEIVEMDAEDGDRDDDYTAHLLGLLQMARKHYVISDAALEAPPQQTAVVKICYALSQIGGGIIHDLQSGAWMDAGIFESLLDAYVAPDMT
jgi:hypothetical protein